MRKPSISAVGVIALGLYCVGCSGDAAPAQDAGWYVDSQTNMQFNDIGTPPPPPPPPPPPDGGADLPPPPPVDTGPAGPLVAVGPGPYYEHTVPGTLDLGTLVKGGTAPLKCTFYIGDGRGTVPSEMTLSDCQLDGGFAATDLPGLYGFIVVVSDSAGASVELPIAVHNGTCNTNEVIITPQEHPVLVVKPGGASSWQWEIKDVDAVCPDGNCAQGCPTCVKYAVGTKLPLKLSPFADCAQTTGAICLANADTQPATACPSVVSWSGEIRIKEHPKLRDPEPAWATMTADVVYSGTKSGMDCGDKSWACHVEVLEVP